MRNLLLNSLVPFTNTKNLLYSLYNANKINEPQDPLNYPNGQQISHSSTTTAILQSLQPIEINKNENPLVLMPTTIISIISPTILSSTTRTIITTFTSAQNSSGHIKESFYNLSEVTVETIPDHIADRNSYLNLTWTWPKGCAVTIFLLLIFITVVGNTLVIMSVLTTRRLRTVTNCFVMNLAVTDWLVGIFVMPPAVILYVVGNWQFGSLLCDIWISLDVLLCTASILSLCAISLDRYLAVIQPLTYSKKRRSKKLAMFMITIVWIVAFSITCPPFFGWYESGRSQSQFVCRYNQNKGYVVFSAMGSFFIPMIVMIYVYLNIGFVLTSRRQRINLTEASEKTPDLDVDCEHFLTETENIIHPDQNKIPFSFQKFKSKTFDNDLSLHQASTPCTNDSLYRNGINSSTTLYELVEISRSSSMIRCSTISCKYASASGPNRNGSKKRSSIGGNGEKIPLESIHYSQRHTSFSESNLSATKYKITHVPHSHDQIHNVHHHHHHHHHQHQQQQHQQKAQHYRVPPMRISTQKRDTNTKTAKTLSMVMGGFIVCWLPFFIYYILIPFLPKEAVSESLMSFLTWVGWVNCAINPFIYAFYNPDFRTAFWRLTFRKIFKRSPNHLALFKG